jgi:hypothetical protein
MVTHGNVFLRVLGEGRGRVCFNIYKFAANIIFQPLRVGKEGGKFKQQRIEARKKKRSVNISTGTLQLDFQIPHVLFSVLAETSPGNKA